MIDIAALNAQLVAQDDALRAKLAAVIDTMSDDTTGQSLVQVVADGLAAIHERQGNMITLMLRTNR